MTLKISRNDGIALGILTLICVLLFGVMVDAMIVEDIGTDYYDQILDARSVMETGESRIARPNLMYNRALIVLNDVLGIEPMQGAWVLSVAVYVLTACIIYGLLRTGGSGIVWSVLLALGLLLAMPFNLLSPREYDAMQLGYLSFNTYHNPTSVLAKGFALMQFALLVLVFRRSWGGIGVLAAGSIITALSMAAKFSFSAVVLPAAGMLALWRTLRRQPVHWGLLIVCGVAALVALVLQWQIASGDDSTRITFSPFLYYSESGLLDVWLPFKWLASLMFPLVVLVLFWHQARHDVGVVLMWGALLVGLAQTILLAEDSIRLLFGNFTWGALYAAFVLFVASTRLVLQQWSTQPRRALVSLMVLGIHMAAGIYWYGYTLSVS